VEQPVTTVEQVEALFKDLRDSEYPVTFVLKSTPPESLRIFDLVVDEIFEEPVTKQGISEMNAQFLAMRHLLGTRLSEEMRETTAKTLHARGLSVPGTDVVPSDELRDVDGYHSGEKLRGIITLAKKVKRHFPDLVNVSTDVKQAKAALALVGAMQRNRLRQLLSLLAPSFPYWCMAVLIHGSLECVVARLCTGQTAIMDLVGTKKITVAQATILIMQWLSGWYVLRIWGWFVAGLFQGRASRTFSIRVRGEVMRTILRQDFEYFDKNPAGHLQERLNNDAEKLNRNLLHIPKELLTELTAVIANAAMVYSMAPTDMFLVAVLPLPLIAAGQWCILKSSQSLHRITRRLGEEAASSTAQVLSEIKTVREFVMEEEEAQRYTASGMVGAKIDEACQSRAGFCGHAMCMLHLTGEAITLLLGVSKVASGEMSAGDLIAIMMMVSCMIGGKLRFIFERISDLALVIEPAGRICDLLTSEPKIENWAGKHHVMIEGRRGLADLLTAISSDGHTVRTLPMAAEDGAEVPADRRLIGLVTALGSTVREPGKEMLERLLKEPSAYPLHLRFTSKLAPQRLSGRFEFKSVDFRYPSDPRKLVLQDVTFTVEKGMQAALTGHAGCGKTTIFKLIQRLYDPTSGQILLDGHPLIEYDVHFLRSKIAIVAQENVLFATSILENVRYGVYPPPSESQVRQALKQASALDFVDAFPDQLLTRVGARGLALSGGQRQRVAIARAMVRQPDVLILDEATSALDPVNEKIVQAALDHLVKTSGACTLTIAHRLTTVKECDKILVFADGRLKEQGTHEELLQIPIERLPPRGTETEGQAIKGLYRVQWNNMMGSKAGENDPDKAAGTPKQDMEGELTKLDAENRALKAQLKLATEKLEMYTAFRKLNSITEGFSSFDGTSLHSSADNSDYASPLTKIQARTLEAHTGNRCRGGADAEHFDAMGGVAPLPLALERYVSSPF
jgi:ABC-type multidrug transport system fused ATPase/permease subunit